MSSSENHSPRPKQIHYLKSWPTYYEEVLAGNKPYEIRKSDRDFAPGDDVVLLEWCPNIVQISPRGYTGREVRGKILRVTAPADLKICAPGALGAGYVILGMRWELP